MKMLSWSTDAKKAIHKGKLLVCVLCTFEMILQRDVTNKRERKTMANDTKSNSVKETDKELPFPSKLLVLVDKWVEHGNPEVAFLGSLLGLAVFWSQCTNGVVSSTGGTGGCQPRWQ